MLPSMASEKSPSLPVTLPIVMSLVPPISRAGLLPTEAIEPVSSDASATPSPSSSVLELSRL